MRLAGQPPLLLGLAASLALASPAFAAARGVRLVQQGHDFAAGRQASGLSARPGGLRVDADATYLSATLDAGFPFAAIGAHWQLTAGLRLDLEIRTSPDGRSWGHWIRVPSEEAIAATTEDGRPHPFGGDALGALVFVDPRSRFVQYRARFEGTARGAGELRRMALHAIDPGRTPQEPRRPRALDVEPSPPAPFGVPKPVIFTREEWGARPSRYPYTYTVAGHLGLHHTATVEDGLAETWEDCAARLRAIQAYHMDTLGWNDIGYNYAVCRHGHLFRAREDEDDTLDVHGAHDGFNSGSAGIAALGYFHPPIDQLPTEDLLKALVELMAWLADLRGIDPLGRDVYLAFGWPVDNVYGHREVKPTACPGDHLFALKEPLRQAVAERLALYRAPVALPE